MYLIFGDGAFEPCVACIKDTGLNFEKSISLLWERKLVYISFDLLELERPVSNRHK